MMKKSTSKLFPVVVYIVDTEEEAETARKEIEDQNLKGRILRRVKHERTTD